MIIELNKIKYFDLKLELWLDILNLIIKVILGGDGGI